MILGIYILTNYDIEGHKLDCNNFSFSLKITVSLYDLTLYGRRWRICNANKNGALRLYYSSDHPKIKLKRKKIQFPVFFILNKV